MFTTIELIKHNNTFFRVIKYVHYNYESTYDSTTNAISFSNSVLYRSSSNLAIHQNLLLCFYFIYFHFYLFGLFYLFFFQIPLSYLTCQNEKSAILETLKRGHSQLSEESNRNNQLELNLKEEASKRMSLEENYQRDKDKLKQLSEEIAQLKAVNHVSDLELSSLRENV